MTWTPVNLAPGVHKDDSPLNAIGYYINADKVRFVNGLPETIYGWERASESTLLGLCRGMYTWQDFGRSAWCALGTHLRLYDMDLDGAITDITPATSYDLASMSLTTVSASDVVTITGWTHGLVVDQKFALANASTSTIGGVTVNGTYVVLTVESATSITYTADQTASSSAGPTAITADVTVYLAPGQEDGLAGSGFGTGGYGSGGYGGGSSGLTLFPRTWSFDQWGQNLLASPRGGAIYEWAPYTTASEILTNGAFSTGGGGWTATGAGWTVTNGAFYTAGSASALTQNVDLDPGAWHLLSFNLTVIAGTLAATYNSLTIATMTATDNYRLPFYSGAGGNNALAFHKDSTGAGIIRAATLQVLTTAQALGAGPTQVGSMFVSAERSVVACGSNLNAAGTGTTDFDPLQIDWSDQEDQFDWAPTSSNYAGGFTLPNGGRIVRGHAGVRENLIWTVDGLWAMRYNGNQETVYDFIELGRGCGLIGPNAAALVGGAWYWMTPEGAYYRYAGGAPEMLASTLARDVFDNLAWVQGDKVYASRVVGKNYAEVWWFYPDSRDGDECSRYIILNTMDGTWSNGTFNRTAYVDGGIFQFPLAADTSGSVWFHEKGFTEDGGPRTWSLTAAYNTNIRGDIIINGVRPDGDDTQGGYAYTFTSRSRRVTGIYDRTYPALEITSATGQRSCRVRGEQVGFTVGGTAAPCFWRMGLTQFDMINVGVR